MKVALSPCSTLVYATKKMFIISSLTIDAQLLCLQLGRRILSAVLIHIGLILTVIHTVELKQLISLILSLPLSLYPSLCVCVCMFDLRPFTLCLFSLTFRATHPYDKESTISMISNTNERKRMTINKRTHKISIQGHLLRRLTKKCYTGLF